MQFLREFQSTFKRISLIFLKNLMQISREFSVIVFKRILRNFFENFMQILREFHSFVKKFSFNF